MEDFIRLKYINYIGIFILFTIVIPLKLNAQELKYYVSPDGNDAWAGNTIDKPFATIQKARDAIRNVKKGKDPITVYLTSGEYHISEPIIFTPEDSGTKSSPITYSASANEIPVIRIDKQENDPSANSWIIFEGQSKSGKYVEFINISGLTFSGGESLALVQQNSDNKTLNSPGIDLNDVRNCIFKDNTIRNIDAPALQIIGEQNEITGNQIYNTVGGGLCVQGSGFLVKSNVIHDIRQAGRKQAGWGILLDSATTNVTIENNLVVRTGVCLYLQEKNRDITIENNVFVNGDLSLLKLSNPKGQTHENIKISNNIFYYTKTDVDLFNIRGNRSLPELSDNNLFWNPSGCIWMNPVMWGIKDVAYFKEWQALGFDKHSLVKDPLFVDLDNDNYSIKPNSPALKVGFKSFDHTNLGLETKME